MNELIFSLRQSWQEAVAPLRQRWLMLTPRDQQVLRVLAIFMAIVILVFGIWQPSQRAALKAKSQYEQNRELLALIRSAGPQSATGSAAAGGSLLVLASDVAASTDLVFSRIEPEGDAQVRVWVERADFNAVAAWLSKLAAQGVNVGEVQAEKQADGQGVSARFVLTR